MFASLQSDFAFRLQSRGAGGPLHLPTLSHTGHKLSDQKSSELYVIVIIRLTYKNGLKCELERIKSFPLKDLKLHTVREKTQRFTIHKIVGALQTIKRTLK